MLTKKVNKVQIKFQMGFLTYRFFNPQGSVIVVSNSQIVKFISYLKSTNILEEKEILVAVLMV